MKLVQLTSENGDRYFLSIPENLNLELCGHEFQKTVDPDHESVHEENELFIKFLTSERGCKRVEVEEIPIPFD